MNIKYFLISLVAFCFGNSLLAMTPQEEQYLKTYGWIMVRQTGVSELGLNDKEQTALLTGAKIGLEGKSLDYDIQQVSSDMQDFLQNKAEAYRDKREKELSLIAEKNKEETKSFYELLNEKERVHKSPTGLFYEIEAEGSLPKPKPQDSVTVHYKGQLTNGEVFDSSYSRGAPATFSLDRVIPGFREGLQLIGKGGRIKLYIPSELGYGNSDIPGIPPGSTLIFEIEVLDVIPQK